MIDKYKNQVGKIIIGRAELRYLVQLLDFPFCVSHHMKASGNIIKIKYKKENILVLIRY